MVNSTSNRGFVSFFLFVKTEFTDITPFRGYMPVSERCSGAVRCHGNPLADRWEFVFPGTGHVGLIYLAEMILRCYT